MDADEGVPYNTGLNKMLISPSSKNPQVGSQDESGGHLSEFLRDPGLLSVSPSPILVLRVRDGSWSSSCTHVRFRPNDEGRGEEERAKEGSRIFPPGFHYNPSARIRCTWLQKRLRNAVVILHGCKLR